MAIIIIIINILYYIWGQFHDSIYLNGNNLSENENNFKTGKIVHPINITFDFSNIPNNENGKSLIKLLKEAENIISKLILCINDRKLSLNEDIISKFKESIKFEKKENLTTDIIILPKLKSFRRSNNETFDINIYNEYGSRRIMPSIAILYINDRKKINQLIINKDSKYILLMESLRALTDCLGLNFKFIKRKKNPRNNFFGTPLYLIENYESYKSFNKLYA